jgi:hypothetical protein
MPSILSLLERPNAGKVIDISIDIQTFIEHVRLTKNAGHPVPDCSYNANKYKLEFILAIERAAQAKIESFSCNWYSLIRSISENENLSMEMRVTTLEAIANDASKLIDA